MSHLLSPLKPGDAAMSHLLSLLKPGDAAMSHLLSPPKPGDAVTHPLLPLHPEGAVTLLHPAVVILIVLMCCVTVTRSCVSKRFCYRCILEIK